MIYKSFPPSPFLRAFVRNYTIIQFQFSANGQIPSKQRAPKPEQKIVFYLQDLPTFIHPATGNMHQPAQVSVFSHQSERRAIQISAAFSAFIIFLQPGVLHNLTRLPMMELLQQCCDAELFFGTEVRVVSEQLAAAKSPSAMIAVAEQFLIGRCKQLQEKTSIEKIAFQILADPTTFSLEGTAQQACLSTKQFYRRFTDQIGLAPKLFSRLARFNHVYRHKISHPSASWSSIAHEFQYTDYHHMEKEFKEFTALTPQEWTETHLSAPERILKLR